MRNEKHIFASCMTKLIWLKFHCRVHFGKGSAMTLSWVSRSKVKVIADLFAFFQMIFISPLPKLVHASHTVCPWVKGVHWPLFKISFLVNVKVIAYHYLSYTTPTMCLLDKGCQMILISKSKFQSKVVENVFYSNVLLLKQSFLRCMVTISMMSSFICYYEKNLLTRRKTFLKACLLQFEIFWHKKWLFKV